jgi:hypothetical protein
MPTNDRRRPATRPIADYATVASSRPVGMDVQTVRRQIANGRIESYQPGRSGRCSSATEIDRYRLASRRGFSHHHHHLRT